MVFALHFVFLLCVMSGLLTASQSQSDNDHCPDGWTQLDNRCYIFKSEKRDFSDAESICRGYGGNLVSIHSDLENAVVRELIRRGSAVFDDTWIGLHDTVQEGDMMWTDGSVTDYFDYGDGEPTGDDCVEMQESDNVVLLTSTSTGRGLQLSLDQFAAGLKINTSKAESMVVTQKMVVYHLRVGDEILPQVEEFMCLCVLFTSEERI
ncbi:galactose-specific lectin nattectin-like [Dunckerocampus dactyliophorus]|uniref:galactose-specific lectin nattectin-like n=1 Tax=Dunckerocampus dactyliophorus TaxID=161453 RepID=UPI002406E86A|nr:galactose-specific lectin nattectin-like [Dunckerocampus dactyliophorus]